MKELNKFRDFLNENKADVFDYADRIMGAEDIEYIDPAALVDYYVENPDEIPEPMDAEIFVANADAIRDRVANYVAMMDEGKDELDEGLFDKVIQKLKDKRAAKKEKERFTKGLDMKDFRKGAPEIDPEFTAGLEENIFSKKGEQRIKASNDMKIGKALSALEDALFELNFLGVISDKDYTNFWMDKYGELYMDTMSQLDPSVQKKYDYEGLEDNEE